MSSISRDHPMPLYGQVKQVLLEQIRNNSFPPSQPLPTEKELEKSFGVSRITIRRAITELVKDGYLTRVAGKGTFIRSPRVQHYDARLGGIREDLTAQGFKVDTKILLNKRRPAPYNIAAVMNITENQELLHIRKLLRRNGEAFCMVDGNYRVEPSLRIPDELVSSHSVTWLLKEEYGYQFHHAVRSMEAALPTEEEAELLECDLMTPIFRVELTVYDVKNDIFAFVKVHYRGDRYRYRHSLVY